MQTKQPEQCSSNHKHYFGERETVPQRSLLLETDQGPGALKVPREAEEGGRATLGSARKGKRQHSSPQKALLDCSLCGKVFSSASSLSKHYLTHSQERKHICKICSKAFKRQDHLTGHMLTHQKTKPFVCIEQGCGKSYCDYRSLRRHCEVQHGLCILKEAPPEEDAFGDSPHAPNTAGQPLPSGLQSLGAPEARSPGSVLPNRDLLRCIVSSLVHQKIPSPGPATVGVPSGEGRNASCPCTASPGLSSRIPGSLGTEVPKEPRPLQKEPAADVFTALDSGTAENSDPNPPESEAPLLQLPSSQEDWPEGGSLATSLPPFQVQKVPASSQPSSHGFQWLQSLPSCPKSKGNNVFMVHKAPREGSESGPGASSTSPPAEPSPSAGSSQDTLPLRPTLLKVPREASGDPRPDSGDEDSWASKKGECFPSDATLLFHQLFLKSQESLASHEQVQVFQMITKSQCIFSHAQVTAPASQPSGPEHKQTALKSLQGPWPQQPQPPTPTVDSVQVGPRSTEPEGSPARRGKPMPAAPREASPSGTQQDAKGAPKGASAPPSLSTPSLDHSWNPDLSSQVKQLRSSKGTLDLGNIFPSVGPRRSQAAGDELPSAQLSENGPALGATRSEKGPACTQGEGYRLFSGHPRAQRFSGFRKEKVKMDVRCAASPSQVAMASFSSTGPPADPAQDVKSKLTIFNRIQGGNIYRLPHPMKEESMAGRCNQQNRSPTDWTEPRSMFVCKNCSQMFYTEKGLSSHMCFHSDQWPSPRGNQEQQGQEKDGEERNDKDGSQHRKRKKRPQPRALFIPPPPSAFGDPGPGGGHQSCLRSPPVFLVDHLLKGLFQCSPYTPPPMLSPIREGSGIYFNTLCSKSQAGPHQLISSTLDQVDGSFSICVVKDDSKISIEPHINIGSRFQAEIPELQERSLARADEHVASMVWKPWGDVMTNPETQDRVTELCNVACSSVMPGGGTNLELALHCLHEAQGSIQVALETLLIRGARKPWTHPLADYRYTGSDIWTPMEKRLFKKAFCAHKKDFYLIHKMIKTKTVAQCVEYYYVWKKMIKFDCGRAPGLEKRVKRELDGVEMTEEKVTCSPQERRNHSPTPELKIKTKSYRRESILNSSPSAGPKRTPEPPGSVESQGVFPCRECDRVFDKIKSRNAHMKRHRLQEHAEPILRVKWPAKPFLLKEEEEEEELGTDISPLQW
ncbi:zinc finger protein 541 isoform X2 [Heterocephalus glaber]|uniref:Zinc finger protein 541 n=1 Tax=Heterocephalus glaber TaxID=10181 RepID=A0AAX6S0X2_HETGA|nr:zinc finger protein 541 isoform X2 [Heterocephalus glaber]